MSEPNDALLELIRAEAIAVEPSAEAKAKTKAKIEASVAAGIAPPVDLAPSATASVLAGSKGVWWLVPLTIVAMVGVGSLVRESAVEVAPIARSSPAEAPSDGDQAVSTVGKEAVHEGEGSGADLGGARATLDGSNRDAGRVRKARRIEPERAKVASTAKRSSARDEVEAPDAPRGGLEAELRLVRRAQLAFGDGAYDDALAAIDEHRQRFPTGVLTQEREALRALTLCALQRSREAAKVIQAFLDAYPTSPQRERVRAACR